jgi:hypothetical protein
MHGLVSGQSCLRSKWHADANWILLKDRQTQGQSTGNVEPVTSPAGQLSQLIKQAPTSHDVTLSSNKNCFFLESTSLMHGFKCLLRFLVLLGLAAIFNLSIHSLQQAINFGSSGLSCPLLHGSLGRLNLHHCAHFFAN